MKLRLTRSGLQSMIMALQGTGITFTKVVIGNGDCPENFQAAEGLSNPVDELGIDEIHQEEEYASITVTYSNQRAETAWNWTEVGVFCLNPFSTEQDPLPDLMYAYGHVTLDEMLPIPIPQKGQTIFEIREVYRIYVGEAENITAILNENSTFVTNYEFNEHKEANNPHGITAATIGLENVQNIPVDEMAPNFEVDEEAELENIQSGDTMQVLMGKISKVITSYLDHMESDNPHHVTADTIGAAEKNHVHGATDITSGTLSVARGGTGFNTVDTTPVSGSAKMVTSDGIYRALAARSETAHKHAAGDITSGTLPVARGGTGQTSLSAVTVGAASVADKLKTARQLRVNLASTAAQTFDGSANKDLGIFGVLPVAYGGTGNNASDGTPTAGSTRMVTSQGIKAYADKVAAPSTSGANSGYVTFANGLKFIWINVALGATYSVGGLSSVCIYPTLPCSISALYAGWCSYQGHSGIIPGDPNYNSTTKISVWLQNVITSTISCESTHRLKAFLIAR